MLLDYADRVVALTNPPAAAQLARELELPPGRVQHVPPDSARLSWLGRYLARTRIGLALGAGGVKGFAHIGALQVLERAGYHVDHIAGSSIGAWVGAWLASGRTVVHVEQILRRSFDPDTVRALYREGALAGDRRGPALIDRLARETTGSRRSRTSPSPSSWSPQTSLDGGLSRSPPVRWPRPSSPR